MASTKITPLIFSLGIILATLTVNCANSQQCQVTEERGVIVNIKQSKAKNSATKVVAGLNSTSATECKEACCKNDKCTVYVFYKSGKQSVNCFLISCVPDSSCVRNNFSSSVVGVVKKGTPEPSTSRSTVGNGVAVTSVKSTDGVTLEMTVKETPLSTTSTAQVVAHTSQQSTGMQSYSTRMTVASPSPVSLSTKTTKITPNEPHNHTTNISLIIALCFGFLFLFAVIVVIGRPWLDFLHRPRYSKVDYLMNGL